LGIVEALSCLSKRTSRHTLAAALDFYGHAPPDPSEAETDVFWLLR
jgi:hypothetical protein